MNDIEYSSKVNKYYSKKLGKYVKVVFVYSYVSIDQIEKILHVLYTGSNSNYGAKFSYSYNFKDIVD